MSQVRNFDPAAYEDPVHDLTLLVRGLRLGERVELPDGTLVRSVSMQRGAHHQRRFAVIPSGTALDRHRRIVLGHEQCKSADEAARKALGNT